MEYTKEEAGTEPKTAAVRSAKQSDIGIRSQGVDQAMDDYSKMAACRFLDTYKSAPIQVQETIDINIEEVSSAKKMILGMELPTLQDAPVELLGFQVVHFKWALQRQISLSKKKQHPVRITRSFYMSTHEITQALYESVMEANPSALLEQTSRRSGFLV